VATDDDGVASVDFVLGPALGSQFVEVTAQGLAGSPLTFIANAEEDPSTLPLRVAQVFAVRRRYKRERNDSPSGHVQSGRRRTLDRRLVALRPRTGERHAAGPWCTGSLTATAGCR